MSKELLIKSAETIEALEATVADLTAKLASAETEKVTLAQAVQAKTASATADEAVKAELAPKAKTAAEKIRAAGLLDSDERRDVLASKIASSHAEALAVIANLAARLPAPATKQASVVVTEDRSVPLTADEVWNQACAKFGK